MSRHIFSIFCANTQTALISSLIAAIVIFQFGLQEMTVPALAQATTDNFTTYENPTYGINMLYPSDWTQSVNPFQSYTDVVAFYSPFQNYNKIYQIIFNAEKSKFDDHLPLVRQIIDSLQIQPP
jgi:hypothetical protein